MAKLFVIHDSLAKCDVAVFIKNTHIEARSAFTDSVRRNSNPDLELLEIGEIAINEADEYQVADVYRFPLMTSYQILQDMDKDNENLQSV